MISQGQLIMNKNSKVFARLMKTKIISAKSNFMNGFDVSGGCTVLNPDQFRIFNAISNISASQNRHRTFRHHIICTSQSRHRSKSAEKKNELSLLYSALIKIKFVCQVNNFAFNGNSLHWEYDCIFAPIMLR